MRAAHLSPSSVRAADAEVERAFRAAYDEHFASIFRLVRRLGVASEHAEDVVQRAFVLTYEHVREGRPVENLAGWLRGVAVNLVREHYRHRRVRAAKAWLLGMLHEAVPRPDEGLERNDAHARVARVLDAMSPKLREVLVLIELEELDLEETARLLRIPKNTVRSRQRLARERFEALYREEASRDR